MGELAGILSSVLWAVSSTLYTEGSRRFGAGNVNRLRLLIGLALYLMTNTIMYGMPLPFDAEPKRWLYFAISGILGLAIGDNLMYNAYNMIGTRLAMLVTALSPILNSILAWLFLDEVLPPTTIAGIALVVIGTGVVVLERQEIGKTKSGRKTYILGLLAAFFAVVMYSLGTILSKQGLSDGFPPNSGASIRMAFAFLFAWIPTLVTGKTREVVQTWRNFPKASRMVALGGVVGPFGVVWLTFIALQSTHVGIASTLTSLTPIFLLPIAKWVYKEKLSWRVIAGTLLAVAGVAVIFLTR